MTHQPVAERIHDWKEVYPGTPGRAVLPMISEQAGRCMDCGIPFSHTGCPLGNLIPEWNDLVWRSDWDEALERLHATNNFPAVTGRLCPAPCETACVVGINRDPVTITNVEVAIIDKGWDKHQVAPQPPEWLTGKKVAVVGSGPAGLGSRRAAHQRRAHGCGLRAVRDAPGGLLRYGIPEFKMEKSVLDRPHPANARRGRRLPLQGSRSVIRSPGVSSRSATTQSCWQSAPPSVVNCRCQGGNLVASIRRWSSLPQANRTAFGPPGERTKSPPRTSTW